jgi:hypothetical protein
MRQVPLAKFHYIGPGRAPHRPCRERIPQTVRYHAPLRSPKSAPDTVFPSRRAECHDTFPVLLYLTDKVRVMNAVIVCNGFCSDSELEYPAPSIRPPFAAPTCQCFSVPRGRVQAAGLFPLRLRGTQGLTARQKSAVYDLR